MKNQEEFDHLIQKRLQNTVVPPPSFAWQNIETELRKKRKKRLAFWWLGGTALLLVSGLGIYRYQNISMQTSSLLSMNEKAKELGSIANNYNPTSGNFNKTNEDKSNIEATEVQNASTSTTLSNGVIANKPENVATERAISSPSQTPKTVHDYLQKDEIKNEVSSPLLALSESKNPFIDTENAELAIESTTQNDLINPVLVNKEIDLLRLKNIFIDKKPTPYLNIKPIKPFWRKKNNRNCYDFSSNDAVFMLEAYIAPLLMQKKLDSIPLVTESGLLGKRKSTESSSFAISTGVRGAMIMGPLVFKAGLNYNQFTEIFRYVDKTSVNVTYYYEIVNGERVEVKPPTSDVGKREITTYNRFYALDIPITAGVELRKRRIGLNLNAGVAPNLFFGKRGQILSAEGNLLKIKGNTDVFKKNIGLSALANAQVFYHYSAQTRFFLEPSYQKILKSVTSNDYSLEQKYQIWGLKLGVARILD
jgi:hypothetical protein